MAGTRDQYLVFLSHSSSDRWVAGQMAAIIDRKGKRLGVCSFLDERGIEAGDSVPEAILDKLRNCREFVVLLSPQSIMRQWVLIEIGAALGLQKHVVPIMYNVARAEIPDIIRHTKAYELNDLDSYVQELVRRARRIRAP